MILITFKNQHNDKKILFNLMKIRFQKLSNIFQKYEKKTFFTKKQLFQTNLSSFCFSGMKKAAIIGSGIAGLGAAIRLAKKGYAVEVFEQNNFPGGKLSEFYLGDYHFDFGPSLFTMPMYVDELFELCGENPREHFHYQRLSTVCHYFWDDGTRLNAYADHDAFAQETAQKLDVSATIVKKYLKKSEAKYKLTGKIFLERSLHQWRTWFSTDVLKSMFQIPFLGIFTSLNKVNENTLKHPKLVQLFNRFATYNGSNPYKTAGIMSIIPHFEHTIGAFIPQNGMYDITKSLYELALRQGIKFHFNQSVKKILVEENIAKGLIIDKKRLLFDKIISNCDIFYTYKNLLPTAKQPTRILQQPKSTSAMIFYWGIKHSFEALDLHNIFFSNDYKKEFEHLANGTVYHDPTVYVNITSKYCPAEAPEGAENWFVMVNVPHDSGQDWETLAAVIKENVIKKVSQNLGQDIASLIVCEEILQPRLIDTKTFSHQGALYGNSSNNMMSAFMRHANFSRDIKNLYFCGGSVHPGGGIPLCLLSAKIVADCVE
jgi:phytoene desaturase